VSILNQLRDTVLLDWLASHHVNPASGVWGDVDTEL
jgi:hypothetical protein